MNRRELIVGLGAVAAAPLLPGGASRLVYDKTLRTIILTAGPSITIRPPSGLSKEMVRDLLAAYDRTVHARRRAASNSIPLPAGRPEHSSDGKATA